LAGYWRQHEVYDGTYDCADLVEVITVLEVKDENARRYEAWKKGQQAGER
jgi:hypothetical protein